MNRHKLFPILPDPRLRDRLNSPGDGALRMVLDTDTFNEIDDQFAVVYALLSPERLFVEALYAAPFHNSRSDGPEDGMEKSYRELQRICSRLGIPSKELVHRGATEYFPPDRPPGESDAARDLIARARAMPANQPLYVAAIGAITNVACAITLAPDIVDKIVVVWLGGHAFHWPDTREFNLFQDVPAARVVFDCGVPLVHIPAMGVASHLLTTVPEIDAWVRGRGAIGDYLAEIFAEYVHPPFGRSKVIWDIAAIAWLLNPGWLPSDLVPSPRVSDDGTWGFESARHSIRSVRWVNRDAVFGDLFEKLARAAPRRFSP